MERTIDQISTTLYNQLNVILARSIEGKGACYISSMERGDIEELLKEFNEAKFPTPPTTQDGIVQTPFCVTSSEVFPSLKFKFDPNAEFTFEEWEEISKRKRPENTKDNKAWAGAWLEGEMVGYARCMVQRVLNKKI